MSTPSSAFLAITIAWCTFHLVVSAVELEDSDWSPILEGLWSPQLVERAIVTRNDKVMKEKPSAHVLTGQKPAPTETGVSETDLYLLGAIEKLVYRVDTLDKRLRRTEELLHHLIKQQGPQIPEPDPCPRNFTRVGLNCFHMSQKEVNWKTASSVCKTFGSHLAEMETIEENQDVVAYLQSSPIYRGKSFWTGGLNPGLLWIWSHSARPVPFNATSTDGRCLQLWYAPPTRSYAYKGADCSARSRYMCEFEQNATGRALERIAKALKLPEH